MDETREQRLQLQREGYVPRWVHDLQNGDHAAMAVRVPYTERQTGDPERVLSRFQVVDIQSTANYQSDDFGTVIADSRSEIFRWMAEKDDGDIEPMHMNGSHPVWVKVADESTVFPEGVLLRTIQHIPAYILHNAAQSEEDQLTIAQWLNQTMADAEERHDELNADMAHTLGVQPCGDPECELHEGDWIAEAP